MEHDWQADDLRDHWTLSDAEHEAVGNKTGAGRLGFAVLLKFFQLNGRFPRDAQEIPAAAIEHVAANVGVDPTAWSGYAWSGSTIEYHCRFSAGRDRAFSEAFPPGPVA